MACRRGKLFCVTYYNDEGYYFYLFYKTLFSLILDALPNIHRKNNKIPSKSISQLDQARRMAQKDQINVYNSSSGNNLNVSSGAAITGA